MADWAGVYNFDTSENLNTRVRRLERGEQYLRAGQLVTPSGKYAGVPTSLLDGNKIDLTSQDLATKGSIPPFGVSGNFGYSATTTSISIFWDGTNASVKLAIIRADGSAVQVPTGSLTVSGLSAGTQYGFLPFWSVFNNCGIGWVKGDVGSPQFAFTSAARTVVNSIQQSYQGREPLSSGFLLISTPASGTGGGTGTGGGGGGTGGSCVRLGTDIQTLGSINYVTEHLPQTDWIHIQAEGYDRSLDCTPDHPLYCPERGKTKAEEFKTGDWIITDHGLRKLLEPRMFFRNCTKVKVKMPHGHLFWANGYLSNNVKLAESP